MSFLSEKKVRRYQISYLVWYHIRYPTHRCTDPPTWYQISFSICKVISDLISGMISDIRYYFLFKKGEEISDLISGKISYKISDVILFFKKKVRRYHIRYHIRSDMIFCSKLYKVVISQPASYQMIWSFCMRENKNDNFVLVKSNNQRNNKMTITWESAESSDKNLGRLHPC